MKPLKTAALAALPVVISIVVGLDVWLGNALFGAARTFQYGRMMWILPVINLIYAALVLVLFWLLGQARDWRIGVFYTVTGAVMMVFPAAHFSGLLVIPGLPFSPVIWDPRRGFWLLGAFILVVGVWGILRGAGVLTTGKQADESHAEAMPSAS